MYFFHFAEKMNATIFFFSVDPYDFFIVSNKVSITHADSEVNLIQFAKYWN